jgi:HD-GYP domain-containing protein (c-di-GMP phosphodiesterase class II)
MLQIINVEELKIGMYVTQVTKQSGKIRITSTGRLNSEIDIKNIVEKGILQIEIDLSKSTHEAEHDEPVDDYVNEAGLSYKDQLNMSLKLQDQAKTIHGSIIRRFAKGQMRDIQDVQEISFEIVDRAFDCNDAISIVTLLKQDSEYLLEHGINCSILMTLFGKHMGIEKDTLYHLGIGALLMDVGMIKMPLLLTQKPNALSAKETEKMQGHVDIGLEMVERCEKIDTASLEVIKQHHERLDGSGYPDGLREQQISQYGRMAAIVDTYDSLTANRPYRDALKPSDALIKMSNEELGLDHKLVASFIECIGVNPVGSLVKLQSNQLALVLRLNTNDPLKPVVIVFYDIKSKGEIRAKQVDLSENEDSIVSSVSPTDFSLDTLAFLKQAFA